MLMLSELKGLSWPQSFESAIHPVTFCCDFVSGNRIVYVARPLVVRSGSEEPGLIATAAKSMDAFDLVSKERVNTLRPACRSCRQSCGC